MEQTRIIAVANQKGGVGKTTTTINLATALASIGERILILDIDPQGNASTGLGIDRNNRVLSSYDVLVRGVNIFEAAIPSLVPNLDIVASTLDLLGVEMEIANKQDRIQRLYKALRNIDKSGADKVSAMGPQGGDNNSAQNGYSYVLIDCPPSLNLLTLNAMVAADSVLVPLQCEFLALEGLSQLLSTISQIRDSANKKLEIQGIVLTMYDGRNNLSNQVVEDVRNFMGDKVYKTIIPRNVRMSEAPSFGQPALVYDLKCSGSQAYLQLASEIIQQEKYLQKKMRQNKSA